MEQKEGYLEFVSSESYKHQIDIWFRTYNISREQIELFYDFLVSVFDLVESTYLGSDVLKYEQDMKNHFTWCWEQTIASFDKEKIYFKEKGGCYEYFWNFFLEAYYFPQYLNEIVRIKEYFYKLFDFTYRKSRSELDMFTEIYKKFEQNLKK